MKTLRGLLAAAAATGAVSSPSSSSVPVGFSPPSLGGVGWSPRSRRRLLRPRPSSSSFGPRRLLTPPSLSRRGLVDIAAAAVDSDVVGGDGASTNDSSSAAVVGIDFADDGIDDETEEEEGEEDPDSSAAAALASSLLDAVSVALKNLCRRRSSLETQASKSSEAESIASRARLISTNLHLLPPGTTSAIVADWDNGGIEVELTLDPGYGSAREESDDLFVKARRMRKGVEVSKGLLEELEKSERILTDAMRDLESALLRGDDDDGVIDEEGVELVKDRLVRTASDTGFRMPSSSGEKDRSSKRRTTQSQNRRKRQGVNPRQFRSPSGLPILVGRNRRDNEHLSFVACRPSDVWMHARGRAGAHVLLRIPNNGPKPTDDDYSFAANLAAFYSDARTERKTEVTCAEPKHVLKPRGAPLGAVKVRKELPSQIGRPHEVPEEIKMAREESGFGSDEAGRQTFGKKAKARARTKSKAKENQAKRRAEKRGKKRRRNKGGETKDDDDADADWY